MSCGLIRSWSAMESDESAGFAAVGKRIGSQGIAVPRQHRGWETVILAGNRTVRDEDGRRRGRCTPAAPRMPMLRLGPVGRGFVRRGEGWRQTPGRGAAVGPRRPKGRSRVLRGFGRA